MAILDNLGAHWRLDEASGDATDVANGHTGTVNGGVGTAAGKIGTARQFTAASSQYFSVADHADLSTGSNSSFTIALWVYLDTFANMAFCGKFGNPSYEYYLGVAGGVFNFQVTAGAVAVNGPTPSAGQWYFVAAWYDGVNINIQVNNGTVNSTAFSSGVPDGTSPFLIGKRGDTAIYMNGRIDSLSFWKRALTSGERTLLYNGGAGLDYPFSSGIVAQPYYALLLGRSGGPF